MRVYVAGAAVEIDHAKLVIFELIRAGHTITHDWTKQVEVEFAAAPDRKENELPDDDCNRWSDADLAGVGLADAFVLIAPGGRRGRGSWVELGYAINEARQRRYTSSPLRLYVIGPYARDSIFTRATPRSTIYQSPLPEAIAALLRDLSWSD